MDYLDKSRNTDWRRVFPDVSKLIDLSINEQRNYVLHKIGKIAT